MVIGTLLLNQHRQQGIIPQLLEIDQIYISQGQPIDSLGHQLLYRMFDQIEIPIIDEAGGKLVEDPNALLDLQQQQTTANAGDCQAIELRKDDAKILRMKSEDEMVTICSYKDDAKNRKNFYMIKEL